ncbi:hypothetical protein F5887DRAFT_861192, partial [Amanita rubescens]
CWRTSAGKKLCSGKREDIRDLVLSLPVILIIEIADDDIEADKPSSWRFSEHLFPLPLPLKEAMNTGMIYELTGLGFYSKAKSHFIARFSSLDRKVVYTYDGRANDGYAMCEQGATSSSHLSAPSIPVPNSYKVCSAVYKLRGGTNAQLNFFHRRKADLATRYHLSTDSNNLEILPKLHYKEVGLTVLDPADRSWISNPIAARTKEYVKDTASTVRHVLTSVQRLEDLQSLDDLPPLKDRVRAGTGALARHGTFWYPVRLIQLVAGVGRQKNILRWKVRWWRGCKFDSRGIKHGSTTVVSLDNIVDSLWLDQKRRREIRLGQWTHPRYGYDESEEILTDPSSIPYTQDVHEALSPSMDVLTKLITAPDSFGKDIKIPARDYLEEKGLNLFRTPVPYVGGVSMTERAQIANWFEVNISRLRELRVMWIGCLPNAHAITLFLADQMQRRAVKKNKKDKHTKEDFISRAWNLQKMNITSMESESISKHQVTVVDVDAECLEALEERMFERSKTAGLAGYYQWGLDAGYHQGHWDPW